MIKAICYGILSSLFFSVTFILNRNMSLLSGSWEWSAALRFLFMLPVLFLLLIPKRRYALPLQKIIQQPLTWMFWSTIGFGLFYAPLCYVASFAPAWLVASSWQVTIPIGVLITPLFSYNTVVNSVKRCVRPKISLPIFLLSCLIVLGVMLLFLPEIDLRSNSKMLTVLLFVIIAAIAYPLGNRKIALGCGDGLTTFQRMFAMCIASMPFWAVVIVFALFNSGLPSRAQLIQSIIVALCSGIIATWLLFEAISLVKPNLQQIAVVESTQSGEVIFTLIGGVVFFNDQLPSLISWCGIIIIIGGMLLNSLYANRLK